MIATNIDYLVLGCSHYPYLIPQIKKILPEHIHNSGGAVAKQTQNVLKTKVGFSTAETNLFFYTNTNPTVLKK
jgi:glutamate racemase